MLIAGARRRWALLLAVLLAAPSAAQGPRSLVQRQGPARVSAPPGRSVTAAFLVSASSPAAATVYAEVEVPEGWRTVSGGGSLRVGPGERRAQLVSVVVPAGAGPGAYVVHLAARAGYATGRDSVLVDVAERRGLVVRLLAAPRFAPAGRGYAADFLVANAGNVESRVRLAARASHDLPARADSALLRLPPGGSREVRVSVATRGVDHALVHEVRLEASDAADPASTAAASGRVELVPGGAARSGRVPADLVVHAAALGGAGLPLSLAGSGALPGGSGTRLDFDLRGRGAGLVGATASDRYSARLRGRGFDVFLGDQLYTLSPLTEPGRPGFGAGGRWSTGPWSVAAFAQRDRRLPGTAPRYGASLGYAARPGALSLNALSVPGEGLAATMRALLHPFDGAALDLEFGTGTTGAEAGGAYSVRLYGTGSWLAYTLHRARAAAGFPAPEGWTAQDRASVRLQPGGGFYLAGYAARFAADAFGAGAGERAAGAGESWRVAAGRGGGFAAEYRHDLRTGAGSAAAPDLETRSLTLRASRTLGPLTLSPHAEVGSAGDPGSPGAPLRVVGLWSALRLGGSSFSAGVERSLRPVPGGASVDRLRGSADATLRAGGATTLRLAARGELDRSGAAGADRGLEAEVERQLPGGHRLVARARAAWREGGLARAPLFLLDYVVPLRLPVPRGLAGGRAAGAVVDAADGRGVEGVLLRLAGRAAVTDRHGRWSMEGLPPGTHYLEVDRLSLGLDHIPEAPMPLRVEVADGRTARLDLRLARSTRVLGSVRRATASGQAGGEAGVEVTLSRGPERHRQTTDSRGGFDFPDLAPGRWLLTARHPALPAGHSLTPDTVQMELAPGERREVSLRVVARARPVRIIAGGEVVVEAEAPRPAPVRAAPKPRPRSRRRPR